MAKQTQTPTIEKDGFVLYRDMVSIANEALPDYHDKGKLFALITQFVNQQPLEDAPERVEIAFKFLKNGIEKNSAKYARKKAAMQAYYEERNKEKSEKEDKSAKSKRAAKNTINNSISTSDSYSDSDSNSNSDSDSNSDSNSKQGIINDTIKENINNNSISHKTIYPLKDVERMLGEREIFFKKNWLFRFWNLNENTYKWKCDPISAAYAFATKYPEALKGNGGIENLPPNSAPPPDIVKQQVENITKLDTAHAQELWKEFGKEIEKSTQIPDEFRQLYIRGRPLHAMRLGYEVRDTLWVEFDKKEDALAFASQFYDITHKELYGYGVNGKIGKVKVQVKK